MRNHVFLIVLTTFATMIVLTSPFAQAQLKADLVVVYKSKAKMLLMHQGEVIKQYHIAMGDYPQKHKQQEGDERTPQGRYTLDYKKSDSDFYKAIHISYPNEADILTANALGIDPGGQIMIHGQSPKSTLPDEIQQKYNWTDGCIAVTNAEMDEIWLIVDEGTPIEIWP